MKCKALGPLAVLALHVLSTPLGVAAQEPAKMPRIGVLEGGDPSTSESLDKVFQDKLRRLGYVEGQNIAIERRWAGRRLDRLPALAAELVRLQVAVIVAAEEPVIRAAKQTTSTIPIVMSSVEDPVGAGFVTSLERPVRQPANHVDEPSRGDVARNKLSEAVANNHRMPVRLGIGCSNRHELCKRRLMTRMWWENRANGERHVRWNRSAPRCV